MSSLLDQPPFVARDDARLLTELNEVVSEHLSGCAPFRRMWPRFEHANVFTELPWVHVGVFKRLTLKTELAGTVHGRTLSSSGTSGTSSSRIVLDERSSKEQSRSSTAILRAMLGDEQVPLLICDHASVLRVRGTVMARTMAAMALQPLSSRVNFVLEAPLEESAVPDLAALERALGDARHVRVYGLTWALWRAWTQTRFPDALARRLAETRIDFVHSGGWKKLEAARIDRDSFEAGLRSVAGPGSRVLDYYGLVEQVGILFPECEHRRRHVPRWAEVIIRDPLTLTPVTRGAGLLQLLNPLTHGAPNASVLTEDLGERFETPCSCGREGSTFTLLGRLPRSELRGCGNV